jgi:asparagine synthase (glutamine-hydrolysing)
MSIIFGFRKPLGATATEPELLHLAEATSRFALDGLSVKTSGRVGMGFQPYYTHARSTLDQEPAFDKYGNLLTFDGRLDNYADLCSELGLNAISAADSQIVLAAFMKWGEHCFSRFIGDWALALWSEREQSLYLARDHAGTRTLHFENDQGTFRWSTHLETFFVDGTTKRLAEGYAACYLASRPIRDLTPYEGILAVLPAHYVILHNEKLSRRPHWQWMASNTIRYRSDNEYEEQFLALFRQSVERRTGPGAPILAQLSGGMDSSSIVCMADYLRTREQASAELLDTLSFYDPSEPSLGDRPYFEAVENHRAKVGTHIELSFRERTFAPNDPSQGEYLVPGADSSTIAREAKLNKAISGRGFRSILSGTGGDELLGGVPTSKPELATLLISGRFGQLIKRSLDWCLVDHTPLFQTLIDTTKYAVSLSARSATRKRSLPPWIEPKLLGICLDMARRDTLNRWPTGASPTSIANGQGWWSIMERLSQRVPEFHARPEYRYPYLDRDLVTYLLSIPREQLVQPGRRRYLMRRSLRGIVPDLILERRRKAYQLRAPLVTIQKSRGRLLELFTKPMVAEFGFVDATALRSAIDRICTRSDPQWWQALMRICAMELWLRNAHVDPTTSAFPLKAAKVMLRKDEAARNRTVQIAP